MSGYARIPLIVTMGQAHEEPLVSSYSSTPADKFPPGLGAPGWQGGGPLRLPTRPALGPVVEGDRSYHHAVRDQLAIERFQGVR